MRFIVHKESGDLDVALLPFKETGKYSYVNLTKGHICKCVFDTVEDALADMEDRKKRGLLISYRRIDDE